MDSFARTLAMAFPDKRPAVFRQISREGIRWHTIKGMEKVDVVDRLRQLGLEARLTEDDIQSALEAAVENPFDPAKVVKPNGSGAKSAPMATLVMKRSSDITPVPISWLWPGRIAIGKQTIVAGEPGLGKSQLSCNIAATVSTAGNWPGQDGPAPLGSVIILSAEDDAADTIRPRLDAAGADATKIHIVSAVREADGKGRRAFNLQADLGLLENEITRLGDAKLVIIDPVSSYLGKVDSHRNAELRAVLEPIGEMAARLGVAVLSVTHLSKGAGGPANSRFIGSIAFVAAARAAFIVARDPDEGERRLFLPTKNNIGPEGSGLGFRVGTVVTPSGIVAPTVFWDSLPVTVTANEVLNASPENGSASARNEAEDFLRETLANGALSVLRIEAEAKTAGLSIRTVRRAKETLGVKASKTGLGGGWCWSLPQDGHG